MSAVHILLYIFIAIIILLCVLSALAYLCYECQDICPKYSLVNKRKLLISENHQLLKHEIPDSGTNVDQHSSGTARLVNVQSTNCTDFVLSNCEEQASHLNECNLQPPHSFSASQSKEINKISQNHTQIMHSNDIKKETSPSPFEINENVQETIKDAKVLVTHQKPPVAVKPLVHLPSSQRHSYIQETDFSIIQKAESQPASQSNSLRKSLKPKAPPPPPPPTYNDNVNDFPPPPLLSETSHLHNLRAENYLYDE